MSTLTQRHSSLSRFRKENLPLPKDFYSRELQLSRPSRGWSRALCPFHNDHRRSLYVNLREGHWVCHACQRRGHDIVSFMTLRYGLTFREACSQLGAWDSSVSAQEQRRDAQSRERHRQAEAAGQERARRDRLDARDWLHSLLRIQNFASNRLSELRQAAPENYPGETETTWGILADSLPQLRDADYVYSRRAGLRDE